MSNTKEKIDSCRKRFQYICSGGTENEFAIYANVIARTPNSITVDRFQKFGELHIGTNTLSLDAFKLYYCPINMI